MTSNTKTKSKSKSNSKSKNKNEEVEYLLNENIDITMINSFYDELKTLLTKSSVIIINAQEVKRLDTSAIQLICSWYTEATSKGIDVKWKNIDGVFYNSVKLLGVSNILALD